MPRSVVRRPVTRLRAGLPPVTRPDSLAAEEPLEIRVAGRPLAVTMRTPGTAETDWDLASGFLLTEGVVTDPEQIAGIRYCAGSVATLVPGVAEPVAQNTYNVLDVGLAPGVAAPDPSLERAFFTTSSCGVCGKASIDAVRTTSGFEVAADPVRLTADLVLGLPDRLRAAQRVFDSTGGLHGAALVDPSGRRPDVVREDVGRHNAVDKVLGAAFRAGDVPARGRVLVVSGRASFELTQKALMAGVPALVAVSAPSSLAVELADAVGMTLVGFVRGDSMVVYAGGSRIDQAVPATPAPATLRG